MAVQMNWSFKRNFFCSLSVDVSEQFFLVPNLYLTDTGWLVFLERVISLYTEVKPEPVSIHYSSEKVIVTWNVILDHLFSGKNEKVLFIVHREPSTGALKNLLLVNRRKPLIFRLRSSKLFKYSVLSNYWTQKLAGGLTLPNRGYITVSLSLTFLQGAKSLDNRQKGVS